MRTIADKFDRDFKGIWIPAEIWLNDNLSFMEVILLAEIDSLANQDGCFASNDYFAKFLGVSEVYVSKAISNLTKKGLVKQVAFNGRSRVLKTTLKEYKPALNKSITLKQKYEADSYNSIRQSNTKVLPYNIVDNKANNNIVSDETQPTKKVAFKSPTVAEVEAYGKSKGFKKTNYLDFWEYYENKGWKVGNVKMKSWQLALNRWERNQTQKNNYGTYKQFKDTSNNAGSLNDSSDYAGI